MDDGKEQETDNQGFCDTEQGPEKSVYAADGGIFNGVIDNVAYEREQQEGNQEPHTDADDLYGKSADIQIACDEISDDVCGKIGSKQGRNPGAELEYALEKTAP